MTVLSGDAFGAWRRYAPACFTEQQFFVKTAAAQGPLTRRTLLPLLTTMKRHRSVPLGALVIALCAVAGGYFGRTALVAQDQVTEQYKIFTAGLRAIENNYVGEMESDRLVYSAITGLLQTLDPHSSFMDPKSYAQTRERQEGRYYGLGITIQVINGDVIVASVFENSPAFSTGLRRGDVIARIETEDTKGWTSDRTVGRLKGPRGTMVNISLRRGGYDQLIDLRVRRDEVHIPTVPAAVMLDATTGYIKVTEFAENTDRELGRALGELTKRGMKRLMLDLRANPGGALDQAILVSNRFLPKGNLIVYTRGRVNDSDQDYRATNPSEYLSVPMITLVNRSSASASEIVSGALQDHDRSLVIGETTFGKALVQSVYRISGGAAALITTAKYYTPSGRLIQRPWDGAFDEYLTYTLRDQEANKSHRAEDLKYTDSGRKVYSGGGVEPDRRFDGPTEGFNPGRFARTIGARGLFDVYARRFTKQGDTRMPPPSSGQRREVATSFQVTDQMLDEFKQLVMKSPIRFDEAGWVKDRPYITAMMQKEIDLDLFGAAHAYENLAKRDPQLQFALGYFSEAQQLLNSGKLSSTRRIARQ
jgi:carboxyl-terminal processing protease